MLGELKLLGYSAYLHPVGDGLLLGVGQDATEQGSRLGTQLSLFDVSDPRRPAAAAPAHARARLVLGRRVGPPRLPALAARLTVLPVDGAAAGFRVGRGGIDPVGSVSQPGSVRGHWWPAGGC